MREHGCVSYAKIATIGGFCDIDLIIIKATAPDDFPLRERYVHELLKIFSICPSSFKAFSLSFTRRFGKTHSWRVALKCLLLLHRLLRLVPENSPFRSELLWTRSNGLLSLYPCHFRDHSSSVPEDYTIFIRSYAHLLDEALHCVAIDGTPWHEGEEPESESLSDKRKEVGRILELLPQLQSLIDRVMECRPTGSAARSYIIRSAMKHIIRDSFLCYTMFRREIVVILDSLIQMPYRNCISAFGIYKKAASQANQLCEFYDWCKAMGSCGSYEYPYIDRIPQIQIQALETFLNGMWQITDSSSSATSPSTLVGSNSSLTEDGSDEQMAMTTIVVVSTQWERFEESAIPKKFEEDEMEPLIQFEVNDNWEALLEASISLSSSRVSPLNNTLFYPNVYGYQCGHGNGYGSESNSGDGHKEETDGWAMQIYNPYNPFHQTNSHEFPASNPLYPWGL
ncbi:hypothetical protein L1049_006864 [Liquidambar formosana]|uniref:ENTH domain-containing protein n=1 Tax=Liquidambar formosana TaxID=63359 RepID=A0AAP0RHU9_LIQFO